MITIYVFNAQGGDRPFRVCSGSHLPPKADWVYTKRTYADADTAFKVETDERIRKALELFGANERGDISGAHMHHVTRGRGKATVDTRAAYAAGYKAASTGGTNPYSHFGQEHFARAWREGFSAAVDETSSGTGAQS